MSDTKLEVGRFTLRVTHEDGRLWLHATAYGRQCLSSPLIGGDGETELNALLDALLVTACGHSFFALEHRELSASEEPRLAALLPRVPQVA